MDLESMDRDTLRTYVDFMLRQIRLAEAFWYLSVEDEYDSKMANHFNERVWHNVARIAAREIIQRFDIREKGLDGFVTALRYYPRTMIVGSQLERKPGELIMSVAECPTQVARLKRGLIEYDCKAMHRGELATFANEVDPTIVVECLHAPPDLHPPERFCKWRFTVRMVGH